MENPLDVIYEDNHLIAVNKNPGQLVQGDRTGDVSLDMLLKDYIRTRYKKPGNVFLGVIHRLDRPVSGVVVFARTSKALARMNALFRDKLVKKGYWCIVGELPSPGSGSLRHFLRKNEKQNKSYAFSTRVKGSKEALLDYRLISRADNYFLLHVDLHTGRHHQIRCQLANAGWPVKGDLKYGSPRSNSDGSISLHAREISFVHPVSREHLLLKAPVPDDPLWQALTLSC